MKNYNKMVLGFIEIIEGIIKIFSLGYYSPIWSYKFCIWDSNKRFK